MGTARGRRRPTHTRRVRGRMRPAPESECRIARHPGECYRHLGCPLPELCRHLVVPGRER